MNESSVSVPTTARLAWMVGVGSPVRVRAVRQIRCTSKGGEEKSEPNPVIVHEKGTAGLG